MYFLKHGNNRAAPDGNPRAGEVTKHKFVGARTIDAGDLIATLEGWTALFRAQGERAL